MKAYVVITTKKIHSLRKHVKPTTHITPSWQSMTWRYESLLNFLSRFLYIWQISSNCSIWQNKTTLNANSGNFEFYCCPQPSELSAHVTRGNSKKFEFCNKTDSFTIALYRQTTGDFWDAELVIASIFYISSYITILFLPCKKPILASSTSNLSFNDHHHHCQSTTYPTVHHAAILDG